MCCSRLVRHGQRYLRLPPAGSFGERGLCFFLLEPSTRLPDDILIRRALLLAAAYRLHCQHRRGLAFSDEEVFRRAIAQAIKEGAVGHARAARALDSLWTSCFLVGITWTCLISFLTPYPLSVDVCFFVASI